MGEANLRSKLRCLCAVGAGVWAGHEDGTLRVLRPAPPGMTSGVMMTAGMSVGAHLKPYQSFPNPNHHSQTLTIISKPLSRGRHAKPQTPKPPNDPKALTSVYGGKRVDVFLD